MPPPTIPPDAPFAACVSSEPLSAPYNHTMDSSWIDATLAWISAHPVLAGAVIFLIAFCDAVIILGALVPALPLLFAVGVFIGLGQISGPYAVACTALGAFVGDGLSYWVGRRWGDQVRGIWPFSRYPQLLTRGEVMFRRNSFKSIWVARYVGAIRPFVPAIAGIMKMPLSRYTRASLPACISWAVLFLLPGWILGEAYDAVAGVAGHLVTVVGLFIPAVLQNGFVITGVQPFWQQVAVGAVLITAVYVDQVRRTAATRGNTQSLWRKFVSGGRRG